MVNFPQTAGEECFLERDRVPFGGSDVGGGAGDQQRTPLPVTLGLPRSRFRPCSLKRGIAWRLHSAQCVAGHISPMPGQPVVYPGHAEGHTVPRIRVAPGAAFAEEASGSHVGWATFLPPRCQQRQPRRKWFFCLFPPLLSHAEGVTARRGAAGPGRRARASAHAPDGLCHPPPGCRDSPGSPRAFNVCLTRARPSAFLTKRI